MDGLSELFGAVFSNHIALSIAYTGMVAGREPTAADMEPMSWAIFSMIRKMSAIEGMGAAVRLQAFARRLVAFLQPYDALLTPALAERPLPLGTLDTAAPESMKTFTRSGLFTPFTPRVQCLRAAGDLAAAVRGYGRPAAGSATRRPPGGRGRAARARGAARSGRSLGGAPAGDGRSRCASLLIRRVGNDTRQSRACATRCPGRRKSTKSIERAPKPPPF
jgi:hypothetical protein